MMKSSKNTLSAKLSKSVMFAAISAGVCWTPALYAQNLAGDFDKDGKQDLLIQNASGAETWAINNGTKGTVTLLLPDNTFKVVAVGDFDGDGKADSVRQNADGSVTKIGIQDAVSVCPVLGAAWSVVGTGDFNGDGKSDILIRRKDGTETKIWMMNGAAIAATYSIPSTPSTEIATIADFNGDGKADLLLRDKTTGSNHRVWQMNGAVVASNLPLTVETGWKVQGAGDYNSDGKADLVVRKTDGSKIQIWMMDGAKPLSTTSIDSSSAWQLAGIGDYNGDARYDLALRNGTQLDILTMADGVVTATTHNSILLTAEGLVLPSPPAGIPRDSRREASRFLRQATFGADRDTIASLVAQGYPAWIEAQFALPATSHYSTVRANPKLLTEPWAVMMPSLWKQYFEGKDQLRQRVSFALSQIFVVSATNNTVQDAPCGTAAYMDILNKHAFGNVRDLMKDVTLSPVMGEYLSMKESGKSDPFLQSQPDENYARELMQLFSIGLVMLNQDGTIKLDGNNKPIPTYDEDTVKGLARSLSGWTYGTQDQSNPYRWIYPDLWDADNSIRAQKGCAAWSTPMKPWMTKYRSADGGARLLDGPAHEMGTKQLLVYPGVKMPTLPANQSPQKDLEDTIDNVFNHPNVGPFIARQLIQRLVTSNPSPAYVSHVAQVFNNNGKGVRGDMKAVIRAILLDTEARSLTVASLPTFGKLTEPVIRFTQLHRAFKAKRGDGYYDLWNFGAATALGQNPLYAPSVFNFFHPDFSPAGPVDARGLVAPEFEITNASTVAGYADFSQWGIVGGFGQYETDKSKWIKPDYSFYVALANSSPSQLLEELDVVLAGGGLSKNFKLDVAAAITKLTNANLTTQGQDRFNMALWLVANSPDYSVQK